MIACKLQLKIIVLPLITMIIMISGAVLGGPGLGPNLPGGRLGRSSTLQRDSLSVEQDWGLLSQGCVEGASPARPGSVGVFRSSSWLLCGLSSDCRELWKVREALLKREVKAQGF